MRVKPKGLPDGDCCSPWQKIMERLREVETGLSQRVKKVKVNGTTIYPVNDGEIVLPDYPESGGTVESVSVNGTKYLPDAQGDVGLPNYPPDLSTRMDAVEGKCDGYDIEIPALDNRLESVEDDVGDLDTAVTGLGNRLDTAENDIDLLEQDFTVLSGEITKKPTMFTGTADPTSATVGHVGDFYLNTADDKLWKCLTASPGDYEWTEVGGGASGSGGYEVWKYATASGISRYETFTKVSDGTQLVGDYFVSYLNTLTEDQIANIRVRGPTSDIINSDGVIARNQTSNYTIVHRVFYSSGNQYTQNAVWKLRTATISTPWSAGSGLSVDLKTLYSYLSPQYDTTVGFSGTTKTAGTTVNLDANYRNISDILVTPELYQMWKDGKVSFNAGFYGAVSVTFEETVTLTELALITAICNSGSDSHDIMVRVSHGSSNRNQRKFYPLEPVGGGTPGAEIWYADVSNPQQATSFSNGDATKTISELLIYIVGLTEEQRHRVFLSFDDLKYLLCAYENYNSVYNRATFISTAGNPHSFPTEFTTSQITLKEPNITVLTHSMPQSITEEPLDFGEVGTPIDAGTTLDCEGHVTEIGLTTELFNKYKSGDITLTPLSDGACTITVVNGYTPTEYGIVYSYTTLSEWHSPIKVFESCGYYDLDQRNIITVE